jgi:transcription termination factor NusA
MPTDLTHVRGIGPAAAETIKQHGIVSAEDLASADIADIVEIPGFGESRASEVIAAAKMAVVGSEGVNSAQPAQPAPVQEQEETTESETKTKKKKKSEKSKGDKKRKKKKKKKRDKGKKKD